MSASSEIKFVSKGWGFEKWIVNCEEYCGKLLYFAKGRKCSWHYHKLKDEVFYVQSGKILVFYSEEDDIYLNGVKRAQSIILCPGDKFHIYRGLRHQILAFSTQHFDSDSYIIEKGD